jgi:hypothetical protein
MRAEFQNIPLVAGLDQAIHAAGLLDARVEPGHEGEE